MVLFSPAARRHAWARDRGTSLVVVVIAVVLALGIPRIATDSTSLAIVVGGLLLAGGFALRAPWALPMVAVPGVVLANQRLGGGSGTGLAVGDALLVAAFFVALPTLRAQTKTLARPLLIVFGFYLLLLGPSLALHPGRVAIIEFFHRIIVVGGGLCVGLTVYRSGRLPIALKLLVFCSAVIAVASVVYTVTHGLAPAYPLGMNKNFAGPVMGRMATVLFIAPAAVDLSPRLQRASIVLLLFGVLATQSRNAIIAIAIAVIIGIVRSGGLRRASAAWTLLAILGLGGYATYTLYTEYQTSQHDVNAHNSYTQRVEVEQQTRDLWRTSVDFGVGLRFFNTPEYGNYQAPNNVFDEVLAEAGLAGAAGMAIFIVGSVVVLRRGKGPLATAGLALVAGAFVSAQFDIFWANGQSLPWLIAGAGCAADVDDADRAPVPIAVAA